MFKKSFEKFSHLLSAFEEKLFGKMYCRQGYHKMELIDPADQSKGVHCVRPKCGLEIKPTICVCPQQKDETGGQAKK
ncbi:MAG: hypothetical protein WC878_05370 [Candidatus Paceibacterota bacterium]|jgi:hypothetical protein